MALVGEESRSAVVRVENLTIGYGDRVVLEAVDLTVWRGEIVTILGGSGCGKSTLLKAMIGLLPPMKGSMALGGRVITGSGNEEALASARGEEILNRRYRLESRRIEAGSPEKFAEVMSQMVAELSIRMREDLCAMAPGSSSRFGD